MKELNHKNVKDTFTQCLLNDNVNNITPICVEGITGSFKFHPDKIKDNESDINDYLMQLPKQFRMSVGGGWSFLNACITENGSMWTDSHMAVEWLMLLGIAIDRVKFLTPRYFWNALPGGIPYFGIIDKEQEENT